MYRGSRAPRIKFLRCNSALVAILTISLTALTAYLITMIANPYRVSTNWTTPGNSTPVDRLDQQNAFSDSRQRHRRTLKTTVQPSKLSRPFSILTNRSIILPIEWQPMVEASEMISTRIQPNEPTQLSASKFKQGLAHLNRSDLLRLLKILQDRIDKSRMTMKKRNVEQEPSASTQNTQGDNKDEPRDEIVVARSPKMRQLMDYLERIESTVPKIDVERLEKFSATNNERSIVRVIRPEVMSAVLQTESKHIPIRSGEELAPWHERIESVAPVEDWPQQQEVVEDWPQTEEPTQRPKKRKKKRRKLVTTTTSTTTTTTPLPVIIETTTYIPPSSPAPTAALEEVWIEEEEDIVRPPRRKLKKYKKKTLPLPRTTTTTSTTTSTTTTTTTTTTRAPTAIVNTILPEEEWPEEQWPEDGTKSPKPIAEPWPQQEDQERWPEEEWLNALRDDIQKRLHIIYV